MLALCDLADVSLVDARVHLHPRQVLGDDEERRRRHAGRHRLADVHVAGDDDAVNGRRDDRVIEVHAILIERAARLGHLRFRRPQRGLGLPHRGLRGFEIGRGNELRLQELVRPLQLQLRVFEGDARALDVGLQPGHGRFGLIDLRLQQRRIEPRDDLALPDLRVEVGIQRLNRAGHLGAHLHGRDGLERARGFDGFHHVAARDLGGHELRRFALGGCLEIRGVSGRDHRNRDDGE